MKKFFILSALVSMSFVACTADKEQFGNLISDGQELYAGFDALSRTYVEDNTYLRWHEDDRLTAFYGNTLNRQYKFKGQTGDNSGSFSHVPSGDLETGNAFDRIYAVYPYDETATITDEGIISLTLPAVQQYAENSFGKGANTMIAVTENLEDTFLAFKNACGYLKLKLYAPEGGVVKSIEVKGNNNEKIAGNATATMAFGEAPVVTMADDATTSITLDCGDGISLGTTAETATEFWVVIPEVTFTEGITITVTDSFDATFTQSTDKEVIIERNAIQPMAALKFEGIKAQPNNEIWYTTSNGESIDLNLTDEYDGEFFFGANVVSNEYKDGKGVITFDGDIVKIDGNNSMSYKGPFIGQDQLTSIAIPNSVSTIKGFYGCSALMNITIPDSVTSIGSGAFSGCTSLTNAAIGNRVNSIGSSAFYGCTSLTHITIPHGVLTIADSAFSGCSSLCKVDIPKSVISIGKSAFSGCTNLSNITIHDTLTSLGTKAFYKSGITSLQIPDGCITNIGSETFSECRSLIDVEIGNGVTTIDAFAFRYCTHLKRVILPTTITTIGQYAFYDNPSLKTIYLKANDIPAIYYHFNSSVHGASFPFNQGMIIFVTHKAYEAITNLNGSTAGSNLRNWYHWKDYIQSYEF